jgi:hypothetical protein
MAEGNKEDVMSTDFGAWPHPVKFNGIPLGVDFDSSSLRTLI